MKNDIHEMTFPCDFWRQCCCKDSGDGHCWGCGCEKSGHKDGEDKAYFTADRIVAAVPRAVRS